MTCSPTQEAACRKEAYQLLLEYFEVIREKKHLVPPTSNCLNQGLSLEKELELLRRDSDKAGLAGQTIDLNMIYTLDIGVKGSVFFAFQPDVDVNPCELVYKIMEDVETTKVKKCRYSVRFVPVDGICYASKEEASLLFGKIAKNKLSDWNTQERNTFAVVFRKRNNSSAHRNEFIDAVAQQMPSTFRVKLEKPHLAILVEVLKTSCLIAIVENYERFCKFNVHELLQRLQTEREMVGNR